MSYQTHVSRGSTVCTNDVRTRLEISEGEKVLELGCGQGDATTVLASAVGETGHITAVDPGELTYGKWELLRSSILIRLHLS